MKFGRGSGGSIPASAQFARRSERRCTHSDAFAGRSDERCTDLDCAGTLDGWQPIGTDYEYTRVDLVKGNFEKQGTCDSGRHEATSAARFGLTVWGWGSALSTGFLSQAVSYAYPAGASVQPINDVIVPPVVSEREAYEFPGPRIVRTIAGTICQRARFDGFCGITAVPPTAATRAIGQDSS